MKGVILAAGDGGRLHPLTLNFPKALLPMENRPLISYPIEAMVAKGITDIAVIVGHKAEHIISELPGCIPGGIRLEFIRNSLYHGGNALSLAAAQEFVGDDRFVLCMADHIIHRDIVARLLAHNGDRPVLCVDSIPIYPSQINDAMRVLTDSYGHLIDIGKQLPEWNGVDTGVFLLGKDVFEVIRYLQTKYGHDVELSQMVEFLIAHDPPFTTCDVSGLYWTDIDTEDDYISTARLMEGFNGFGL